MAFGGTIKLTGETEYKKALSEITSNLKVLGSEMKLATASYDKNDTSTAALTSRNKELSKQMDEHKKKVVVLSQAYEQAKKETGDNSETTKKWQVELNNAKANVATLEKEIKNNNKTMQESGVAAENSADQYDKFGKTVKTIGAAVAVSAAAIVSATVSSAKAVWDMANQTAQAGDSIDKTSQKIGISAEAYQEWSYVFERSGADVDKLQVGMKTLSTVIADAGTGSASAAEKLNQVGLSVADLNGLSQDEQLSIVIGKLQEMGAGAERTAAATDLLGKSGVDMAAVLNMTAEDTQALIDEAHTYGMVMSNEAVAASANFEDSLTKMKNTVSGLKNGLVAELLPGLSQVMDGVSDMVSGTDGAADKMKNGIYSIISSAKKILPQLLTVAGEIVSQLIPLVVGILPDVVGTTISILPEAVSAVIDIFPQLTTAIISMVPDMLESVLPVVVDGALELVASLLGSIGSIIPEISTMALSLVNSVSTIIVEHVPDLINAAVTFFCAILQALPEILSQLSIQVPAIIDTVITTLSDNFDSILKCGINLLLNLIHGIKDNLSKVSDAANDIFEKIKTGISDKISEAKTWGKDLIDNFVQGIKDKISRLKDTVTSVATTIKNIIGFSEPKEGPLSNFHTYAPDMIDLFVSGIKQNVGKINNAFSDGLNIRQSVNGIAYKVNTEMTIQKNEVYDRSSGNDTVVKLLSLISSTLEKQNGYKIVLDSGQLVGALADPLDNRLGVIAAQKRRA